MEQQFLDHLFHTISRTIVHSLWLGLVLSVMAGLVLILTVRSSPRVRYGWLCCLFFLFPGATGICFIMEWNSPLALSGLAGDVTFASGDAAEASGFSAYFHSFIRALDRHASVVVLIWIFLAFINSARLTIDIFSMRQLRRRQVFFPGDEWNARLAVLRDRMGVARMVTLLESAMVKVPLVAGHLKPVILVPLGFLLSLPPGEVQAILLHELAHVRRSDYLVNLIQRMAGIIFFFNPGLLWVSSLLRREREFCCDELVLEGTHDKAQYVQALVSFKEQAMLRRVTAMAFPGSSNQLLHRVKWIVYHRNRSMSGGESVFMLLNAMAFAGIMFAGLNSAGTAMALISTDAHTSSSRPLKALAQYEREQTQVELDRQQSEPVQAQAERDRAQAEKDQAQAERDRAQAERDRAQAKMDYVQAGKDRAQAEQDRAQADKDRIQADIERAQADRERMQAALERAQADRDHF